MIGRGPRGLRRPDGEQRGVATFAGESSIAVTLPRRMSGPYAITLIPSVDSYDGSIPAVAYDAKTDRGFTIVVLAGFEGTVDWTATPSS